MLFISVDKWFAKALKYYEFCAYTDMENFCLTSMPSYAVTWNCGRWKTIVSAAAVRYSSYLSTFDVMLLHIHWYNEGKKA
jgi:hypothetical protein